MADLNDYKLVNNRSKALFNQLKNTPELNETQQCRLGFYHLIMENITGIKDVDSISKYINDTEYNKIIFNHSVDDLGIDAVYIDDESDETTINLFNFKFREKFSDSNKEENSLSRSTKFLEYIVTEDDTFLAKLPNDKVKDSILQIRACLNDTKICNLILYMISNETKGFAPSSNMYISILEKDYGMKIKTISLDDILGFVVPVKFEKECKFILNSSDFLSFSIDEESTQKSYVIKISLIDLIRITCTNSQLNINQNMENDDSISNCKLDFSLLYDNVRGYLGLTTYNEGIQDTINLNAGNFFMYNNGVTLTVEKIECEKINSGKKYLFTMNNYQIVNGGQTIRAIYEFLENHNEVTNIESLRNASILVRLFKVPLDDDNELKNSIAEYTNSQNKISNSDLKSVDRVQIQIEKYLQESNILYKRKAGDLGNTSISYIHSISKERLAQILYSSYGFPNKASNQKKKLFNEFYDEVFKSNNFSLEKLPKLCSLYFSIEDEYNKTTHPYYELKSFYIIYICQNFDKKLTEAINILETAISNLKQTYTQSESRLLLRNVVKEEIDKIAASS